MRYLDQDSPVNWNHWLNRGLAGLWIALPQAAGASGWGSMYIRDLVSKNHGLLTSGPQWAGGGRPGGRGALSLDGSNDYINFGDQPAFEFASGQGWGIGFWFRSTATTTQSGLLTKGYDSIFGINDVPLYLLRWNAAGNAGWVDAFIRRSDNTVYTPFVTGLTDGGWHRLDVVYDPAAATISVYRDGLVPNVNAVATGVVADAFGTNSSPLIFGTHASGFFPGLLDCLTVYSRALSASSVWTLYDQSRRGHPDTLRWLTPRAWFLPAPAAGPGGVRPWWTYATQQVIGGPGGAA